MPEGWKWGVDGAAIANWVFWGSEETALVVEAIVASLAIDCFPHFNEGF